jgi:RimJ/RimL family protein N-acetyltransferase
LDIFFQQQLDPEANWMAAFGRKDPSDRAAFDAHWAKIRADTGVILRTILAADEIAGYVTVHAWFGEPEIAYFVGKQYWGQGIATRALAQFLEMVPARPLHARVVKDNLGSLRVLQKNGFTITGKEKSFSDIRGAEVEELILTLEQPDESC